MQLSKSIKGNLVAQSFMSLHSVWVTGMVGGKVGISNPKTRAQPNNARTRSPISGFSRFLWVGTHSSPNFQVAALALLNQNLREIGNILILDPAPGMKILTQMLMHFFGLTFVCRLALHLMTLRIFCKLQTYKN